MWRWGLGLHFCATGIEGSAAPRLHTPAAGFPRHVAAGTEAGSPASADLLRNDNSALLVVGEETSLVYYLLNPVKRFLLQLGEVLKLGVQVPQESLILKK